VSWGWESEAPGASRFVDHHEWQGTRDLSAFLSVDAALEFVEAHDWARVQAEGHRLAVDTRRRVDELTGLDPISPDDGWIGQMAAIRLPERTNPVALQTALFERHRVEVPMHQWAGIPLLRVSFAAHTAQRDADALLEALRVELPLAGGAARAG
jgi:isopenicillin-N epimerase